MDDIKIGYLLAIAWRLEKGEDNGSLTKKALAAFLRSVAESLDRKSEKASYHDNHHPIGMGCDCCRTKRED